MATHPNEIRQTQDRRGSQAHFARYDFDTLLPYRRDEKIPPLFLSVFIYLPHEEFRPIRKLSRKIRGRRRKRIAIPSEAAEGWSMKWNSCRRIAYVYIRKSQGSVLKSRGRGRCCGSTHYDYRDYVVVGVPHSRSLTFKDAL